MQLVPRAGPRFWAACLLNTPRCPASLSLLRPLRQVAALGMPPPERRADSLQALQGLDFFGGEVPDERQLLEWEASCRDWG